VLTGRLKAIWLLSWALLRALVRRLFGRRGGLAAFRANYDPDGLPPVTLEERRRLPAFSRCIACGVCDRGEGERMAKSAGAYPGPMTMVLAVSRSMPDFRAAARSFGFVSDAVLEQKEQVCPTGVPFREIAEFVRRKADEVGGPLVSEPPAPKPAASGSVAAAARTTPSAGGAGAEL
jgi:hypothetical protein